MTTTYVLLQDFTPAETKRVLDFVERIENSHTNSEEEN